MKSYPIGQRGEAVWYDIQTTSSGLIQQLSQFCTEEGEHDGVHSFSYDGNAHDVVDLVHKAESFTDGNASISYTILDTAEQDWGACITIQDGKIVEVLEESVPVE